MFIFRLATRRLATRRLADSQLADSQLADSQLADSQLADSQLADSQLAYYTNSLFIETCLCVKDTLSARNNHVTNGMIDSLLMLRLARACLNLAMLTFFFGVWQKHLEIQ